MTGKEQL